jgi:hypothetical protein
MFGHLIPRNHSQAGETDEKNRNKSWQEVEELELTAILGYGVFNNIGFRTPGPNRHKKINVHFVYAVKHNGRYKTRLVAGGHLTDTPINSVYSSVDSLRGVRLVMFLAELNGLKFWSTDIGNAYLKSNTLDKILLLEVKNLVVLA